MSRTFQNASPVPHVGSFQATMTQGAANSTFALRYDPGVTKTLIWVRTYIYIPALPAAIMTLWSIFNGASKVSDCRLNTTGTVFLRDNNTLVATSTSALTTGTWHRLAYYINPTGSAPQQKLNMYLGSNADGAVGAQDEQISGSASGTSQTGVDSVRGGLVASTASADTLVLDDYAIDDANEPGPTIVGTSNYYIAHQVVIG
jgi:hypothetical protein